MQATADNSPSGRLRLVVANTCLLAAVVTTAHLPAFAAEQVELSLSLDENGAYAVDDLLEACNRALKTTYPVEQYRGKRRLLSPTERAALMLADEFGLVEAQFTSDRLTLKFSASDDGQRKQEIRRRLRQWFKLPEDYWTANYGLQSPEGFRSDRRTLLVIHGLEASTVDVAPFDRACRATGIQLLKFGYPNDGSLATAGQRLHADLQQLAGDHPRLRLAVVGQSMGGLVARYCIEAPGSDPCGITDLFLLGTPNHGSLLAQDYGLYELLQALPHGTSGLRNTLSDGLGEAAVDLEPGSEFLTMLNALPRAANVRYHAGIGSRSFLAADERERLLVEVRRVLDQRQVPDASKHRLIELASAAEFIDGAADGAVTIESARLRGCSTERIFPLNHLGLFSLAGPRPEQSEVFQWILATMGWQPRERGR
jgi:pimeloyl-ACP methyl ester carboxylesterase